MNHKILLVFLIVLSWEYNSYAREFTSCKFQDTIDLRLAHRFPNGSYFYDNKIFITAKQVHIYDYKELFDGRRVAVEPHPRACICNAENNCLRFCCQQPVREYITNLSFGCEESHIDLPYTAHHNITYGNGSIISRDVTKDFILTSGIPCQNAYALDLVGGAQWQLYANGTLSIFNGELHLERRHYCMAFAPKENGKEKILTPMLCPVAVENEEITLEVVSSVAGIITTLFIIATVLAYVLLPNLQNFQGKLLICFLVCLAVGSITLSIIALPNVVLPHFLCGFIGYIAYYFLVASYFWLNIISYNMFKKLHLSSGDLENKKPFIFYAVYAMGLPLCLSLILIILENSNIGLDYKSGIGGDFCWFSPTNWSALTYLFGLNAILLCLDISFYMVVIITLKSSLKLNPDSKQHFQQLQFAQRYGLLLLVMALVCLIDTVTNIKSVHQSSDENFWFYLSSFVSAIFGFVIFLIFGLGPLRQWRHQRLCLRSGYIPDDTTTNDFENIEISTKEFS
ncbi:probable G-protein coupled receptor Mth-like 10 [Musca domestica]|uniref:Probable G-protein coupled receptor Mth-like 10 n=1 Tax=Musca domestica TaxID=7370 RepID=A0A9J7D4R3_MUSDO|nr:probable G-protein coupled receptor Mth-like 10 [Musca domestica]